MTTNLLIDTSFFFMRSLSATDFKPYLKENERVLDSEKTQAIFIRKVAMDLAFQIKKFADINIGRIVLCTDSSSWRKQLYAEYKGTRTKSEDVNWTKFYSLCDYFISLLEKKECISTNIKGLEGDDLLYYYSLLFKSDENLNIIISSDKDLKQLVSFNTIVHNVITNKYTVCHNFKLKTRSNSVIDIMDLKDEDFSLNRSLNALKGILEDCERINGYDILFSKILLGDKSDNITQLVPMFGTKKVEAMLEKYKEELNTKDFYVKLIRDENACMELFDRMSLEKKKMEYTDEFKDKVIRNTKLTWLSTHVIPKELSILFKEWVTENKDKLNYKAKTYKMTSMQDILEGTDYVAKDDYENDDSIFAPINFNEIQ